MFENGIGAEESTPVEVITAPISEEVEVVVEEDADAEEEQKQRLLYLGAAVAGVGVLYFLTK